MTTFSESKLIREHLKMNRIHKTHNQIIVRSEVQLSNRTTLTYEGF